MVGKSIQLEQIAFLGPIKERVIDFMLGGSSIKEIPERAPYSSAALKFSFINDEHWKVADALSGGNFELSAVEPSSDCPVVKLKQTHAQGKTDNISGFLLDNIGLLNRRLLKSKAKAATQSFSFRNLARLIIIQEGEIQSPQSPFLTDQFTTVTPEMAAVKLLITGIDDSAVVSTIEDSPDSTRQLLSKQRWHHDEQMTGTKLLQVQSSHFG